VTESSTERQEETRPADAGPGGAEHPGGDRLEERASELARTHTVGTVRPRLLLPRLAENRAALRAARQRFEAAARAGRPISPAAEWLLDNTHVVREHLQQIRTDLTQGYYRELPKLAGGPAAGVPRVYDIAVEIVAHADSHIDLDVLTRFVRAYQAVTVLTSGELWAVPIMLRLALIENLRRVIDQSLAAHRTREAAEACADRLTTPDTDAEGAIRAIAAALQLHADMDAAFTVELLHRLRDLGPQVAPALDWLEERLERRGASIESVVRLEHQRSATSRVTIGNSIGSLRTLSTIEWGEFFESVSAVEAELRGDPAGVYPRMDFASRDQYRHVVERGARRCGISEVDFARRVVAMSRAEPPTARSRHVGWYLVDAGRPRLVRELGWRPALGDRLREFVLARPTPLYVGAIALATALLVAGATAIAAAAGAPGAALLAVAVLAAMPTSVVAMTLVHAAVAAGLQPRALPKLAFEAGVPPEHRTLVVVPVLLDTVSGVQRLLNDLESRFLINADAHVHFGLASDFADAHAAERPEDVLLVDTAVAGIRRLNATYGDGRDDRFYLFHRRRTWNARDRMWMGWERKRGKLMELNRLLRGATDTTYAVVIGDRTILSQVQFVLTLDADTEAPFGTVRRLAGTLAHPLNAPVVDTTTNRVERGYGIVQPSVAVSIVAAASSRLAQIFSGDHSGLDPYAHAVTSVDQDLFGVGSYVGKAIYDVDTIHAVLRDRFPENLLLSHDLLEGAYARTALATDIRLLEDFPSGYDALLRREHRWARGDWQIVDWLLPWVPSRTGRRVRNTLPWRERWKIFDNLRRSLVEPAVVAWLWAGWTWLPGSPVVWTTMALLAFLFPRLVAATATANAHPPGETWRGYVWAVAEQAALEATRAGLAVVFLLTGAIRSADAIARAQMRRWITRRHLLEWISAADVEHSQARTLRDFWARLWTGPALAAAMATIVAVVAPHALVAAAPILAAWCAAPFAAAWLSRPAVRREPPLSAPARARLQEFARQTWSFYETLAGAEDHWLPPDNLQEWPRRVVAHRTSPTNIGLLLLAAISARDLGLIDLEGVLERWERIFESLDRLERHRGHFLNWYDTRTLEPLRPAYVSTVDSGNLAAALVVVAQCCGEIDAADGSAARARAMAERAESLLAAMDFGFLFDRGREVFTTGYNVTAQRLDTSYFDLLMSEARLASFIAIARGQVPPRHWFRLARPFTRAGRHLCVLSWGGTMFEYLMPPIWLRDPEQSLLRQTYDSAIRRQIEHGNRHRAPWGVSESGFHAVDLHDNYQYKMFGVPELALRRDDGGELVVTPYATFLALPFAPHAAWANLERLEREGATGEFGFFEAIDYTPSRRPRGQRGAVVRSYMAHHQGMILVTLGNYLSGDTIPRRFHAAPVIAAAEVLLQERLPRHVPLARTRADEPSLPTGPPAVEAPAVVPLATPHTPSPRTHLLSNGAYTVMVTNAGGGSSTWRDLAVTRWRSDPTRDAWGSFCYVHDVARGVVWSTTYQPCAVEPRNYEVIFTPDKAEFRRLDAGVETRTEIVVSPHDDVEVRRIGITARSRLACELELTSYAEVVLDTARADEAHPAFGKLFVESEFVPEHRALLFRRRPRSSAQPERWAFHMLVVESGPVEGVEYETDRARFLGRGRTPADAEALRRSLSGTVGAVLDPIMSLRCRICPHPEDSVRVSFVTGVAASRDEALALCTTYCDPLAIDRAFDLASAQSQIELRHLNLSAAQALLFQRVASRILYAEPSLRAAPEVLARNDRDRSALWAYGISGDHPIALVSIADAAETDLVREMLLAHEFWRLKGLGVDLVICNEHPSTYAGEVQGRVQTLVDTSLSRPYLGKPGGVFLLRGDQMPESDRVLLQTLARIVLVGELGGLTEQLKRAAIRGGRDGFDVAPRGPQRRRRAGNGSAAGDLSTELALPQSLIFANGLGGFTRDGREYVVRLARGAWTPTPWVNVVANERFGCVASDAGLGVTWCDNSQLQRLTPWSNDPVSDAPGEALYVRDQESGRVCSPAALPVHASGPHRVRHRAGSSVYEHVTDDLALELLVFVPSDDPVKILRLRLRNRDSRPRRLTATYYVEWVLGTTRSETAPFVLTGHDDVSGAWLARNTAGPGGIAFAAGDRKPQDGTTDRREFLGRNRGPASPAGLEAARLSGRVGGGDDACAAVRTWIDLPPGAETEVVFLLGQGGDLDEVRRLVGRYRDPAHVEAALVAVRTFWDDTLHALRVETPDPALDVLVNHWLLYQVLACRLWARTALYQSGGAYGFRDQLQDAMALVAAAPARTRAHLLRAASRQFEAGDVQHWWHEPGGQGVRTRCSDDLLWLPFATAHYRRATGDAGVLDAVVPFLQALPLAPDQDEVYSPGTPHGEARSLYEHCARALDRSDATGAHGLPLMGGGDWNDGMNRVGHAGRGESVWLGWFVYANLIQFAPLADARGDTARARAWRARAERLRQALHDHAWDGAWYRRAYDDDGAPIGSAASSECRIDSIAQSWAVLSGAAPLDRARAAMAAVETHLVRERDGLVLLLTPPFDGQGHDPGYIQGYVPGIRENGGQYTHAALWVVWAYAALGDGDRAGALLRLLNPIYHAATPQDVARYKVEPYVVAADIYSHPAHVGRGGWTWYTGSAAWMYRVIIEALLGLQWRGDRLRVSPCLPRDWPGYRATLRRGATSWEIEIQRGDPAVRAAGSEGAATSETAGKSASAARSESDGKSASAGGFRIELDGVTLPGLEFPLTDDGRRHHVRVRLAAPAEPPPYESSRAAARSHDPW
jgi:cyclic beta-1,2-glucan synthetase